MLYLYFTYIDDENDKTFFENIYVSYRKQMIMTAMMVLHNQADAEDVVHEVFLKIAIRHMRMLQSLKNETDRRNYLLKAVQNTAINWHKKNSRTQSLEREDILCCKVSNIKNDVFVDYICQKMTYEQVIYAIKQLDKKYFNAIYYHFVLEIPVPKVADLLSQTVAATKKQLVRGKKQLLAILAEGEHINVND